MTTIPRPRCACLLAATLLSAAPAAAQDSSPPSPAEGEATVGRDPTRDTEVPDVNEIVVKGQLLRNEENAFSTTSFVNDDIKDRRIAEVETLFREVPGMNARDYNLSGVANQIVIRGFANGGHGGDLGVVIDGIPLNEANSHADGYVDTNVLIPLEIGGLTVYRGPVSALYGNFNRGGLIAFETRKGGDYVETDVSGGEFGTVDVQGAAGFGVGGKGQFNGALQIFRSDGFRPQSENYRITGAARLAFSLAPDLDLSISARGQASEGDSPAYLTLAQFETDPFGIDPRVQNDGAEKDFGTLRADLAYTLSPELRLLAFAYTTQQNFTRWFSRGGAAPTAVWAQREEAYDRSVYGAGASLNGSVAIGGGQATFVVGVEGFSEDTQYQFYDNLIRRRRTAPAQFDRTQGLESLSAFGEANVAIDPLLQLSLGLRYDRFTGDCTRDGTEVPATACARFESVDNLSPKVGVRSQLAPWLQLRASYAQGFSLPSGQSKFQTGAQGLDPNAIDQIEGGLKLTPGAGLELDAIVYRVISSNEIASTAPGVFVNFGKTERTGLEASLLWRPSDAVELRAVYAHADSNIEENVTPALVGKDVTGVPDDSLTIFAAVYPIAQLRLDAVYRYVGEYFADAPNTLVSPDYGVFDIGASYELDEVLNVPGRIYLDIDNVTDETYASTFNSLSSIGTGAPRLIRVGVQLGF